MKIGQAIDVMKQGYKVAREGWNGKDMFLYYVAGSEFEVNREPLQGILGKGTKVQYHAHIDMKTAQRILRAVAMFPS